jgi:hypothetical protein
MADLLVSCIKRNGNSSHESITHLGNTAVPWKWTRAEVINSIEAKTNTFYTEAQGHRGYVGVVNGPTGKYLRTYASGRWNDDLLLLRQCP